jgi:hypothetical protein
MAKPEDFINKIEIIMQALSGFHDHAGIVFVFEILRHKPSATLHATQNTDKSRFISAFIKDILVLHKNLFCGIITTAFLSSSDST